LKPSEVGSSKLPGAKLEDRMTDYPKWLDHKISCPRQREEISIKKCFDCEWVLQVQRNRVECEVEGKRYFIYSREYENERPRKNTKST